MLFGKIYSYFLVTAQFLLIFLISLHSSFKTSNIFPTLIFILGLFLGLYAIFVMRKSKLRITPNVSKNATFVNDGPYKYIRHPMYLSVLLICLGLVLTNIYYLTTFFYILLFAILSLKINYEEKLLKKAFKNYPEYKAKTNKLIPFLY